MSVDATHSVYPRLCTHICRALLLHFSGCFSDGDGVRSSSDYFVRWSGSHIRWGQPFRLRHVTTGKYLSLMEDKNLLLMDKEKADVKSTAFAFRSSKVRGTMPFWDFWPGGPALFLWCWKHRKNECEVFPSPASLSKLFLYQVSFLNY